jgi:serine protease Do
MLRPSRGNCRSRPAPGMFVCLLGAAYLLFAASLMAQAPEQTGPPMPCANSASPLRRSSGKVSSSVVQIVVTGYGPLEESSHSETGLVIGRRHAIGSGVIVDPDGYIITNAHVVSGTQRAQVVVPFAPVETSPIRSLGAASGRMVVARVVGVARDIDLALMKVEARDLPVLRSAKYSEPRQGEMVFAFGSPEGRRNSVTMGVVSAVVLQVERGGTLRYLAFQMQ